MFLSNRPFHIAPRALACAALMITGFSSLAAFAAVPQNARIPLPFTGVWAQQSDHCSPQSNEPSFTIAPRGFEGLPGEKAHPQVKQLDSAGRNIRVSFYNSNGALSWRSIEFLRLSKDGNRLAYTFAGGTLNWVRCSGPMTASQRNAEGSGQPNG